MHRLTQKQRHPRKKGQQEESSKGRKSMRGQPDNSYGELKKAVTFSLTPTGLFELDQMSQEHGISRSELLERIGRQKAAFFEVKQSEVNTSELQPETDAF